MCEYDPDIVAFEELLEIFWKSHDPTQVRLYNTALLHSTHVGSLIRLTAEWRKLAALL